MEPGPAEKREVAYHEAGHAVASYLMRIPVRSATIVPSGDWAGQVTNFQTPALVEKLQTGRLAPRECDRCYREVITILAGTLAQEQFSQRPASPLEGESDREQAWNYAGSLSGSDEEAEALLAWLHCRAKNLLTRQQTWPLVVAVAEVLLARNTLNGREVRRICEETTAGPLQRWGARPVCGPSS